MKCRHRLLLFNCAHQALEFWQAVAPNHPGGPSWLWDHPPPLHRLFALFALLPICTFALFAHLHICKICPFCPFANLHRSSAAHFNPLFCRESVLRLWLEEKKSTNLEDKKSTKMEEKKSTNLGDKKSTNFGSTSS